MRLRRPSARRCVASGFCGLAALLGGGCCSKCAARLLARCRSRTPCLCCTHLPFRCGAVTARHGDLLLCGTARLPLHLGRNPAASRRRETGEEKVILTALCGHGFLDLPAYSVFLQGNLKDIPLSREKLEEAFAHLPMREATAK